MDRSPVRDSCRDSRADIAAWLYLIVSPMIAFLIVLVGTGVTEGGGDFCDPVYSSNTERDAQFRMATLIIVACCIVMLAIGAALLVRLVRNRQRMLRWPRTRLCLGVAAVAVAMAGYGYLAITTDNTADCGGIHGAGVPPAVVVV